MAVQYIYPVSDVAVNGWVRVPADGALYTAIDEVTLDVADGIHVESQPFAGDPDFGYTFALGTATDPGINAGHTFELWVQMAGSGSHEMRFDLIQNTGGGEIVVATRNILLSNPGVAEEKLVAFTEGEIANLSNYADVRGAVTLLSDTTSWTLDVFRARFGIPIVYAHLDIDGPGLKVVPAASGNYLVLDGPGYRRVTGLEDSGALVLGATGIEIHS